MKVQTNLRAGKQNRGATSGSNSTDSVDAPEVTLCRSAAASAF